MKQARSIGSASRIARANPKKSASSKTSTAGRAGQGGRGPFTLAIDIGGSGLKAAVLDAHGTMASERLRVATPQPCSPRVLVEALSALVKPLPPFDRISVGFPGLIRHGRVLTAPNLSTAAFAGFDLKAALETALRAPVRAINDADMQGLAAIAGRGVEMVITLGTGFGTALFQDGRLQTHLEIAHLPFRKGETYDQQLGEAARKDVGKKKWDARVHEAIANLRTLTCFDHLYIGGGNARHLQGALPDDITVVDNSAGILGGIKLWDELLEDV